MTNAFIDPYAVDNNHPVKVLQTAPQSIHGAFYFASRDVMLSYSKLYHDSVKYMHSLIVADDDQAVVVQAYIRQPEMFKLWYNMNLIQGAEYYGWFSELSVFNKNMLTIKNVQLFLTANGV